MESLAGRLRAAYPALAVETGSNDPAGFDIVVNATPLGMKPGDPMPVEIERIAPSTFVGEVVMKEEITPFLAAVRARGCAFQVGSDMLFEQIPAYLEFFGLPSTTPEELRASPGVARSSRMRALAMVTRRRPVATMATLAGFPAARMALVLRPEVRVAAGGDHAGHVEGGAQAGPPAGDGVASRAGRPLWSGCGAMPARLAAALRSSAAELGHVGDDDAGDAPGRCRGSRRRIVALARERGIGVDRGRRARRSTSAQPPRAPAITARWLAAIPASTAWARRVFSMAISSVSWRRRVESALIATCFGGGGGAEASGMRRAKRAMRPASSRSVLAMRPFGGAEGAHLARVGDADLEAVRDQRAGQRPRRRGRSPRARRGRRRAAQRLDQRRDAGAVVADAQRLRGRIEAEVEKDLADVDAGDGGGCEHVFL